MMNNSIQQLQTWAGSIQPNQQYKPVDLLPGGPSAPPHESGVTVVVDPAREAIRLFRGEHGAFVKTVSPWGGEFRVMGLSLLEALCEVCRVGYPAWRSSMDEKKNYLVGLLADAESVTIPARGPLSRIEMEQFIDVDPSCQRVVGAFTEAIDAAGAPVTDAHLREFIERSTSNPEQAVMYYNKLRDGRRGIIAAPASEKPARTKRAVHPLTVTQEA